MAKAKKSASSASTGSADPTRMDTESDKLAEQIRYHNEKYWVEHKPEISDIEYDQLVEKLRALQPDHPALVELVEDKAEEGFKKVQHDVPMLSIEKVFTVEDVIKWGNDACAFNSQHAEDGIVEGFDQAIHRLMNLVRPLEEHVDLHETAVEAQRCGSNAHGQNISLIGCTL